MRRKVAMLVGAAALTGGAHSERRRSDRARSCGARRASSNLHAGREGSLRSSLGPVLRPVSSPGLRPLALLVRLVLNTKAHILHRRRPVAGSPYPVTSSASRPLSGWPYSPVASTKTG
jgi:hypothetical protein